MWKTEACLRLRRNTLRSGVTTAPYEYELAPKKQDGLREEAELQNPMRQAFYL